MLHEWGYTLTPGDNCMFNLTKSDVRDIREAWNLLHGDEDDSKYNLREGDMKIFEEMEKRG